jgi:4-amino-4-deoxy-L-arabinose transferase-like glycosyltransferase
VTRDAERAHDARPLWGLAILLLLALGLRLGAVVWLADTAPYSDYFYYHEAGRFTAEDWWLWMDAERVQRLAKLSWWPPGYPMFLGLVYEIFGPDHRAVVFLQALLGAAVCGLVYATARRALDARLGFVCALLVAVNPTYVFTTNLIASENLFAFWLALALWLAVRSWHGRREPNLVGVTLALAALTRGVGLVLLPIFALWIHARTRRADSKAVSPSPRGRQVAWMLASFLLVLAPWSIRNALVVGPTLVSYGGGLNFYYGHNEGLIGYRPIPETPMAGLRTARDVDRRAWELGLRHLASDPLAFFTRGAIKMRELFATPAYALNANTAIQLPDGSIQLLTGRHDASEPEGPTVRARHRPKAAVLRGTFTDVARLHSWLLLGAALIALLLWRRLTPELRFMAWLSLSWAAVHVVFWGQPRFRYPLEIPLALLASFTLVRGFALLRSRARESKRRGHA